MNILAKNCTRCKEAKHIDSYGKRKAKKDGRESFCKECNRKRNKKWHEENKERAAKTSKEWYAKNKAARSEYNRKWREENSEHFREYMLKYCEENKEQIAQKNRAWGQKNKDKVVAASHKRRALLANAAGSHTAEQAKARFGYHGNRCIYCGSREELQVEHMIPITRGGANWPSNLAPACGKCNRTKRTKTFKEFVHDA